MVNKITTPPTQNEVIDKINEFVDGKQDMLVSGTNIKTVNGTSLLGSGNIAFDSSLSTSSTNAVQNKIVTLALNGKLDGFNISVYGAWTGGAHAVNFLTVDYSTADNNNGVYIKTSMVSAHGNGVNGKFFQDVILSVSYTGAVTGTIYRYFAENVEYSDSSFYGHKWGDIFWTIDTTNKIVKFYVLIRQYSYAFETPYFRLNSSTGGTITQHSGSSTEYSSGTQTWATINWFDTDQTFSATSPRPQSGIALNNAKFLQNLSANNTSLSIFGNGASSLTGNAINIGYSSTAINSGDIAIGRGSNARGSVSIALGFDATVSNNCYNAIQLGTGTNSTANTFNVGFRNVNNYQLLNGITGLIPDARISTNIARTSALSGYQTTDNLVTSVSSSSTDSQYPSAKLFYDTVGDIETALNTINSGSFAQTVDITVQITGSVSYFLNTFTLGDAVYTLSDFEVEVSGYTMTVSVEKNITLNWYATASYDATCSPSSGSVYTDENKNIQITITD